jgi:hypothetical protein
MALMASRGRRLRATLFGQSFDALTAARFGAPYSSSPIRCPALCARTASSNSVNVAHLMGADMYRRTQPETR